MEPWQHYLDELRVRSERIPPRAYGRGEMLAESAHDAYQRTTDHLTTTGWDPEEALTVVRLFNSLVKSWIRRDGEDWSALEVTLQDGYEAWTSRDGRER